LTTRSDTFQAKAGRNRGAVRWLTLVCAFGLLVPAVPAQAAPKYGVTSARTPTSTEMSRLTQGNAQMIRTEFRWDDVERDNGHYDGLVASAAAQGRRLLPVIGGTPEQFVPKPGKYPSGQPFTSNEAAMDRLRGYLRTIVGRYGGPGGTIREWQVWNEPNIPQFAAGGKPKAKEYAKLLKITVTTIRSVDPQAKIVLAGMPELTRNGTNMAEYLRELYRVKKIEKLFDVIAIHPYTTDKFGADGVEGALIRTRRALKKLGESRTKLRITETGFGTDGDPRPGFTVSESKQAKLLGQIFKRVRQEGRSYKVDSVLWFCFRDFDTQNRFWYNFSGLFRQGGDPKPAWSRFTGFTGGSDGGGANVGSANKSAEPFAGPFPGVGVDEAAEAERETTANLIPSPPE